MLNMEKILENPEIEYRPRNYWGWLENITPKETRWQIDRMAEVGLGGYVMHARGGLAIPYAGQQWMDSVRAMIDEGRKHGMVTIVDDEHGWPSGFGAGKVNGKGEKYQLKYLKCEWVEPDAPEKGRILGVWTKENGRCLRVYVEVDPYYVDNMDPDVVDAFLEASYEDYNRQVGSDFGNGGVYGIFSDEPQTARYATPWSDTLPEMFEKEYGYPLLPELNKVFENVSGCEKLRYELYALMARCFTENYAGRINRWCDAHGVKFLGHTTWEEDLARQLRCAISTMPFYEHMSVPGIDWLGRQSLSNLAILQVTSAAAQTGKKRVLSEMFGIAGWSITFEEMKWIAQWQHVLGINDQLQHLGLYSLRGSRKREYPASIFYQQPWFKKMKPYNTYFARISKLLAESRQQTDLLVLHPMHSAWVVYDGTEESLSSMTQNFSSLLDQLLGLGLSPHLGDETLLLRHGRVVGNQIEVGNCRYSSVLLPPLVTMDTSTYRLLKEFERSGGKIYAIGSLPHMLDGVPAKVELSCTIINGSEEALKHVFSAPITMTGGNGFTYLTRWNWRGEEFWYIVNNDLNVPSDICLKWPEHGNLYAYDPMANELAKEPTDIAHIHLEGGEALLLFANRESSMFETSIPLKEGLSQKKKLSPMKKEQYENCMHLDGKWNVEHVTENALTLDSCCLSFDGVRYTEEQYVLDIQKQLLKGGVNRDVWLKFHFVSEFDTDLYLLVENPEKCTITVNGVPAGKPCGWRIDKCLEAIPVTARTGENEIVIARRFENEERVYYVKNNEIHEAEANRVTVNTELESIYLFGDFAVKGMVTDTNGPRRTIATKRNFSICPLPKVVDISKIEQEGFLFFAGEITLSRKIEVEKACEACLRFQRPDAGYTEISVNDETIPFYWAPYECPVSLEKGENTIRVTLINSCRNLFGPHYSLEGDSYNVTPESFGRETEEMHFVRLGIEKGIEIFY